MLSRGLLSQRSSSIAGNALKSRFHSAPRHLFESLFSAPIPKGFGKFYPPGGASGGKTAGESASKARANAGKSSSGAGGAGGGAGGGDFNHETNLPMFALAAFALAASLTMFGPETPGKEISWQEFSGKLLESGQVDRILISNKTTARVVIRAAPAEGMGEAAVIDAANDAGVGHQPVGDPKEGADDSKHVRYPRLNQPLTNTAQYYFVIGSVESFERKLEDAQRALNIAPRDFVPVMYVDETSYVNELVRLIPTIMVVALAIAAARMTASSLSQGGAGGGIFKMGKSKAKKVNKEMMTTTFADVAGCDEAKKEIMELVEFLKDSKRFTDLGAKIPKGALLCGPPGTGKTLLAKATAGESNVPFFSISGSDFLEMYAGVGSSRVRELFKEARENAPCIVFIDEIDAIGKQRGKGGAMVNDERESTLNQLLVEMDGFDPSTNVVVLAGTNRADTLDTALLRPGRFDRQIQVDAPDISGREAIFQVYLKNITLDGLPVDYSARLAALTPGFTGADIANICNEAAILAARRMKTMVDMRDFETATERIIGGLESHKAMSPEVRRVIAYHEAGHAVAGWNLEHADPLLKVTIIPRGGGALGFAQYLPQEIFLRTKEQILDRVCVSLAGRASEQVNFGEVTTGASDDLRKVTDTVYQMVQVYGMNDRIGQVAFPKEEGNGFGPPDRLYSNATAEIMDEEVKIIVDEAYRRTIKLMQDKKEQVILVAELLLLKETITNMDVAALIGKRPFQQSEQYEKYAASGWGVNVKKQEAPEEAASEQEEGSAGPIPAFSVGLPPDWHTGK